MKRTKKAVIWGQSHASFRSLEHCRMEMNYWRESYNDWRKVLGEANREKNARRKANALKSIAFSRACLMEWIIAVEIKLAK